MLYITYVPMCDTMTIPRSLQPDSDQPADDFKQQLLQYQQRIANILESFTDGFFETDENWIITYWNKEAERILQMQKEAVIGNNLWEIYHDAVPLKFHEEYHKAVNQNISVRFEEYYAPRNIWLEVAAFPSGKGLSVYFKDITVNKRATAMLRSERQKYIDLFNLSPVPQWVYDLDTLCFLDVNEAAVAHYGYSRKEFLSMTIKDIRPQSDVPALEKTLLDDVKPGIFNKSIVRHSKKSGELMTVYVEGNSVFFEGKNARLVMVIDRTPELKAVQAMEKSINRYRIVSKATSDAIWDLDIQAGEMGWNRGIKGIFGHDIESSSFEWWKNHVHADDLGKVLRKFDLLFGNRSSKLKIEYRFRCADGSYRFVLDRAFILFDESGKAIRIIGSMQDITERVKVVKTLEEQNAQLREISWIQSHKVRSPLAKILGLIELMDLNKSDLVALNEFLPLVKHSAAELDQVLREILERIK